MRVASLVGVWMLLLTAGAEAGGSCEACKIFDDVGDKFALGRLLMNTDASKLVANGDMTPQELEECFSATDDCFYHHKDGIQYIIGRYYKSDSSDFPGAHAMDLIGVAEADASYTGPLIAGIKWGDTIEEVRRKLKTLPSDFPQWEFTDLSGERREGPMFFFSTEPCIRSSNGAIWSYTLSFDWQKKLVHIEAQEENYRSST